MKNKKLVYRLSCLAFAVAAVVVLLGAFTRLVDAGLGCPDWPTCYGHVWVPTSEADIAKANENFSHAPVETHKTWPEQIHRIFASSLGLIILGIFAVALVGRNEKTPWRSVVLLLGVLVAGTVGRVIIGDKLDPLLLLFVACYFLNLCRLNWMQPTANNTSSMPFKLPALLAGLVILQGLFGMWTVTLNLWPQVVTAHLLGGFTTLALIWLLIQRCGNYTWQLNSAVLSELNTIKVLALIGLVVVALQIALGGWTTSNYAALACADFPKCHNTWLPETDFAQGFNFLQHVGPNYLGGVMDNAARTAIHFSHRLGALLTFVVMALLAFRLFRVESPLAKRWAVIVISGTVLQIALGISNVVFALPLAIAVAHNAGGAALLLILVTLNHRLRTAKAS